MPAARYLVYIRCFLGISQLEDATSLSESEDSSVDWVLIIGAVAGIALLTGIICCAFYRRRGKDGRADQMRRNLGYTPDMESKGEGNFGPTTKHVAITRGDGPKPTPEMLATKPFKGTYTAHHRTPSEAPSSIIEDNIANNYRPKQAQQVHAKKPHGIFEFKVLDILVCLSRSIAPLKRRILP